MKIIKKLAALAILALVLGQQVLANHDQDRQPSEPYSFSYTAESLGGLTSHQESGDGTGRVVGFYTILGDDGRQRRVDYVADENGYRATVKTNEMGTKAGSTADAQFLVQMPSQGQLEAAQAPLDRRINMEAQLELGRFRAGGSGAPGEAWQAIERSREPLQGGRAPRQTLGRSRETSTPLGGIKTAANATRSSQAQQVAQLAVNTDRSSAVEMSHDSSGDNHFASKVQPGPLKQRVNEVDIRRPPVWLQADQQAEAIKQVTSGGPPAAPVASQSSLDRQKSELAPTLPASKPDKSDAELGWRASTIPTTPSAQQNNQEPGQRHIDEQRTSLELTDQQQSVTEAAKPVTDSPLPQTTPRVAVEQQDNATESGKPELVSQTALEPTQTSVSWASSSSESSTLQQQRAENGPHPVYQAPTTTRSPLGDLWRDSVSAKPVEAVASPREANVTQAAVSWATTSAPDRANDTRAELAVAELPTPPARLSAVRGIKGRARVAALFGRSSNAGRNDLAQAGAFGSRVSG